MTPFGARGERAALSPRHAGLRPTRRGVSFKSRPLALARLRRYSLRTRGSWLDARGSLGSTEFTEFFLFGDVAGRGGRLRRRRRPWGLTPPSETRFTGGYSAGTLQVLAHSFYSSMRGSKIIRLIREIRIKIIEATAMPARAIYNANLVNFTNLANCFSPLHSDMKKPRANHLEAEKWGAPI